MANTDLPCASVSKRVLVNEFDLHEKEHISIWFRMMTRFETEAQRNSKTIIASQIIRSNHYEEAKSVMKQSETSKRGWGEKQSRFWQSQAWEN